MSSIHSLSSYLERQTLISFEDNRSEQDLQLNRSDEPNTEQFSLISTFKLYKRLLHKRILTEN